MNDFKVLIEAVLDKAKLSKDIQNVQKLVNSKKVALKVNIDQANLRKDITKISGSLAKSFSKKIKLNIDSQDAVNAVKSVYKEQEKLHKSQGIIELKQQLKYYNHIQENLKNINALKIRLKTTDSFETDEIRKQISLLEKRNNYYSIQLNKKVPKDETSNLEFNQINDSLSKKIKHSSTKATPKKLHNMRTDEEKAIDLFNISTVFSKEFENSIDRVFNKIIINLQKIPEKANIGEIIDKDLLKKVEIKCHTIGTEFDYIKNSIDSLHDPNTEVLKELADTFNALPKNIEELSNPISWIGLTITSISLLMNKLNKMKKETIEGTEASKQLIQNYGTAIDKANTNANTIEEMIPRYSKLADGVDNLGKNVKLTAEEYKEYNELTNQIADMFPNLVSGYTNEGTAIINLKGNIEKLRDSYKDAQREASKLLTLPSKSAEEIIQHYQDKTQGKTYFLQGLTNFSGTAGSETIIEIMDALSNTSDIIDFRDTYRALLKKYEKKTLTSDLQDAFEKAGLYSPKFTRYTDSDTDPLGVDNIDYTKITWEDLETIKKNARSVAQTYRAEANAELSNIKEFINLFISQNEDYNLLDEEIQNAISILLNSVNSDIAKDFKSPEDIGNYVNKTIGSLNSNIDARNALVDLLTLDTTNMTVYNIKATVDDYVKKISEALDTEDPITLKTKLGFENIDNLVTNYDMAIEQFLNNIKDRKPQLAELLSLKSKEVGGTVDVTNQPSIPPYELINAGWDYKFQNNYNAKETLYSKSFFNENGTSTVLVTPILPDGTILSPEDLEAYAKDLLAGKTIDANILLGKFDGKNSIQDAKLYSQYLDQLQEDFYAQEINTPEKLMSFFDNNGINTQEKIDYWNQVTEGIYSLSRAERAFIKDQTDRRSTSLTMSYQDAYNTSREEIQKAEDNISKLQAALDLLRTNNLGLEDVTALINEFPELNSYVDITSEKFGDLKKGLETLSKQAPKEVIASLKEIRPLAEEDQKAIETLINSLEIKSGIQIDYSMQESLELYDELSSKLTTLSDLQSDLGKSFSLTTQQARKYAEIFPELLSLGTVNAEGLIELNEEAVSSFIEGKEKELTADRTTRIAQLENRKNAIEGEIDEVQAHLNLLESASNGDIDAKNQLLAALAEADDNYAQHQSDVTTALTNDDADAKKIMSDNISEYDRIAANVSTNIHSNLSDSIDKSANNVRLRSEGMIDSLFKIGIQAIASARAILSIGTRNPTELKKEEIKDELPELQPYVPVSQLDTNFNKREKKSLNIDKYIETSKTVDLKRLESLNEEKDSLQGKINLLKSQNQPIDIPSPDSHKEPSDINNSNTTKIDWIKQIIDFLDKKHTELDEKANSTALSYLGLSKKELDRATVLAENGMPEADDLNEFINLAQKAGISYNDLFEKIQNNDDLGSRQTYLEMRAENDKIALNEYGKIVDAYKAYYEDLAVNLSPEYRNLIENGSLYIEMVPAEEADNLKEVMAARSEYMAQYSEQIKRLEQYKQSIIDVHENRIKVLDHEGELVENNNKLINSQIEYLKSCGEIIPISFYDTLIANSDKTIKIIENKIIEKNKELQDLLNDETINVDQKSEDAYKIQNEIDALQASKIDEAASKEKLVYNRLRIPIDNVNIIIGMYNDISTNLQNWGAELEASGKKLDNDYYQILISNGSTIIDQYKEQSILVQDLMNQYTAGSDPWNDLYSELQSINGEISSMVQNLYAWNEALLQMPLDSIKDYSSSLQQALDGMTDLQSDYDTVISAVTTAIQDQIDALQEENDLTNETYQNQIDALQEQLDLLDKANEARQHQLSVEQALYELDKARNQKSTKVIRNGEITYESDSDAIRNAENNLADAKYELEKYNLQTQMDGLQEELDGINKTYDDQTEKLENISKKWSEIKDNIEKAGNAALANEYLGAGWQDKILSGNDADLYNTFKSVYESLASQKSQYEEQIESTENIYALLENYIASYKDGTLSYDQAMSGINDLLSQMNQKMSATDNLQNIFDYLGTANGTAANADAILSGIQNALTGTADELLKSMEQYNKNSGMISEYTTSWQQLTDNVASMKDILEEVRDALENASDRDDDDFDDDDSERHISQYNNDEDSEFEYRKDGIKGGLVGKNPSKSRETAMKLLAEAKLDSNEIPAILHSGEAVLNAEQQEMLMRNFAAAAYYTPLDNFIMPNYRSILTENSHANGPQNIEVTIGDVDVHGVKNVEEFINSMATLSGQALREQFGKTRSL